MRSVLHDMTREVDRNAPGLRLGIDEAMIETLVHTFYGEVRRDDLLGPIFNRAVKDWDTHLAKLCAFWSSVTLASGRYRGTPMRAHAELPGIAPEHFARWLALFEETARRICPPEAAEIFVERAQRIGQSLQYGIAIHRGETDGPLAHLGRSKSSPG